jgi:Acyltransferase family
VMPGGAGVTMTLCTQAHGGRCAHIVMESSSRSGRDQALTGRRALAGWTAGREPYLDNLKVLLIVAIIAIHAVLSYTGTIEAWSYTAVREVTLDPIVEIALLVTVSPFGYFIITLLFLMAGLLTGPSVQRKGPAGFARDRLVRLGVPFLVYVLVVQPVTMYLLEHPLGEAPGSYWDEFLGDERQLDTGPLWFVGVLLIFSLAYAGWVALAGTPSGWPGRPVTVKLLTVTTMAVAAVAFAVRMAYPYGGDSGFTDLNFWQWPACLAVFGLGVTASRLGWLKSVPDSLHRRCRLITVVATGAMIGLLTLVGALDLVGQAMGGASWPAAGFAVVESTLSIFGAVWVLGAAQRHLAGGLWSERLSRSVYGAFMVQTVVLIGVAAAMRPVPLPAEAKAVLLAGAGVAASFALAWLLITRIPGMDRVL